MSVNLKPVKAWNFGTPANGVAMYQDTIKPLDDNIKALAEQANKCVQVEPQNFTKAEKDQARKNLDADNGRIHRFCLYWTDTPYGSSGETCCLLGDMEQLNEQGTDVLPLTKERLYEIYKNNEVLLFTSYPYSSTQKHWGIAADVDIYFRGEAGDFDNLYVDIRFYLPVQYHGMRDPECYQVCDFTLNGEPSPYLLVKGPNATGHYNSRGEYKMALPDKGETIPLLSDLSHDVYQDEHKVSVSYDSEEGCWVGNIKNYCFNTLRFRVSGSSSNNPEIRLYCDTTPNLNQSSSSEHWLYDSCLFTFVNVIFDYDEGTQPVIAKPYKFRFFRKMTVLGTETINECQSGFAQGKWENRKPYCILVTGGYSKSFTHPELNPTDIGSWTVLNEKTKQVHHVGFGGHTYNNKGQDTGHTDTYLRNLDAYDGDDYVETLKGFPKVTAEEVIKWRENGEIIILHYGQEIINEWDNEYHLYSFTNQSTRDSTTEEITNYAVRLEFTSVGHDPVVIETISFITNSSGYVILNGTEEHDVETLYVAARPEKTAITHDISKGYVSIPANAVTVLTIPSGYAGNSLNLNLNSVDIYQAPVDLSVEIHTEVSIDLKATLPDSSTVYWVGGNNSITAGKDYLLRCTGHCCELLEISAQQS